MPSFHKETESGNIIFISSYEDNMYQKNLPIIFPTKLFSCEKLSKN